MNEPDYRMASGEGQHKESENSTCNFQQVCCGLIRQQCGIANQGFIKQVFFQSFEKEHGGQETKALVQIHLYYYSSSASHQLQHTFHKIQVILLAA